MKRWLMLAIIFMLIGSAAHSHQPPVGYIGLSVDDEHEYYCAEGAGFYPVEMWVWCLPSYLGQMCAEFDVCYPVNVIKSTVTWNYTFIDLPDGEPDDGINVCFTECQWDWHWLFHRLLYVTDPTKTYVEICPHPDIGVYQFANCEEGYPTEPCTKLTNLYLNYGPNDPECIICTPPDIESVEVISQHAIVATLDDPHIPIVPGDLPRFEAYRVNDPTDSLLVTLVYTDEESIDRNRIFTIHFGNQIQPDTTYILRGEHLCGCCGCCGSSSMEFAYDPTATLLRSHVSAYADGGAMITWVMHDIDEGVSFAIHKRRGSSGEFIPIDSPAITRSDLTFTFRDLDVEDGGTYQYRIYAVAGEGTRLLLFESNPVLVPARPVTLYQNNPNPFNPATTIRFYLPEQTHVTLGVFDVGGRRIATLVDDYRARGAHAVEWNGEDADGGRVASGIYFYRLKAGKDTITKKMALLR